jgi:hypothetical protein
LYRLSGLAGLAFADDFRRWLEHADKLAFAAGVAAEDAGPGLLHHQPQERHHRVDLAGQAFQCQLFEDINRPFHARRDLCGETLRLPHHATRRAE